MLNTSWNFINRIKDKLLKFKRPRTFIMLVLGLFCLGVLPWLYQESWLDPFSTLNVPDRFLHPHAFSKIGYVDSSDPSHPFFSADKSLAQGLIRDLGSARPSTQYTIEELAGMKVLYFTLHRDSSRFHSAADFPLQFYPGLSIVRFGEQEFQVNEATLLFLDKLPQKMVSGWWSI
ncbi:MAG: hypothetical protein ACYCVD_05650 [Desulfitobacteriaceae bacterium]